MLDFSLPVEWELELGNEIDHGSLDVLSLALGQEILLGLENSEHSDLKNFEVHLGFPKNPVVVSEVPVV